VGGRALVDVGSLEGLRLGALKSERLRDSRAFLILSLVQLLLEFVLKLFELRTSFDIIYHWRE